MRAYIALFRLSPQCGLMSPYRLRQCGLRLRLLRFAQCAFARRKRRFWGRPISPFGLQYGLMSPYRLRQCGLRLRLLRFAQCAFARRKRRFWGRPISPFGLQYGLMSPYRLRQCGLRLRLLRFAQYAFARRKRRFFDASPPNSIGCVPGLQKTDKQPSRCGKSPSASSPRIKRHK